MLCYVVGPRLVDAGPTQDWGPPQRRDQQDTKETAGREHHFTHSNPHCQRYPFQYLLALYVLRWGPPRDSLSGHALFGNGITPARLGPPLRRDNSSVFCWVTAGHATHGTGWALRPPHRRVNGRAHPRLGPTSKT